MGEAKEIKILSNEALGTFVENLIGAGRVVGVRKKDNKWFKFDEIEAPDQFCLDYDVTLLPPKKYFLPQKESLLSFSLDNKPKLSSAGDFEPLTIVGIHPYDLIAINQIDKLFTDTNRDEQYLRRRENITIIAVDPKKASKWSFWSYIGATKVDSGYDLFLTDLDGKWAVEIGTKKGGKLLKKHAKAIDADKSDLEKRARIRNNLVNLCNTDRKLSVEPEEIPSLMEENFSNKIWGEQAEKCYSCGSCNLICPTCYCFDVREEVELNLKNGSRERTWDGCLLNDFAVVAGGENFRGKRPDRYRHRFFRKGVYINKKIGELACVGCGRCSSVCLPDIADPVKVINRLAEGS